MNKIVSLEQRLAREDKGRAEIREKVEYFLQKKSILLLFLSS